MSADPNTGTSSELSDGLRTALGANFDVLREIGRGGMGIVYAGRDLQLDRAVAIKVLAPGSDATARERFLREARTAARLSHPNIVAVYRADQSGDLAFFVMEYVDGVTLEELVANARPLSARRAAVVLRDAASALAHAHAKGVVHRDVKPSNIMIESGTKRVVLTDFGIAQADITADNAAELTQTGQILGSISYLSPEQSAGEPIDARTDVYSLGVVGYRIVSGRVPFEGTAGAVLTAHITRAATPIGSLVSDADPALTEVIECAMAKSPDDRFNSAAEMARALGDVLSGLAGSGATGGDVAPEVRADSSTTPEARLSDAQASLVWRRASELEADATGRHIREAHPEPAVRDDADGAGLLESAVRAAAEEAGIAPQFVQRALEEVKAHSTGVVPQASTAPGDAISRVLLGSDQRSITVSRIIDGSPSRVRAAMLDLLQGSTFALLLRDVDEESSPGQSTLTFDLPASGTPQAVLGGSWVYLRTSMGARQLTVSTRRAPASTPQKERCEVVVHSSVLPGRKGNLIGMGVLDAFSGLLGGGAGWIIAAKVAVAGAATAGWAPGLGLIGLALGALGTRKAYVGSLKRAQKEIDNSLNAVEAHLRTVTLLARADGKKLPRRANPDDESVPPSVR